MANTDTHSRPRRRAPGRRVSRGKQIARWVAVFFALAVLVDAFIGERGVFAMLRAREQYEAAAAALDHQRDANVALRERVTRLTDDLSAIEELAREELGLIQPGEKLFIVKDLKPQNGH